MKLFPYFRILRIANLLMLGLSVALGFWLSHSPASLLGLGLMIAAAACCAGFGNVVNDIADIETDRISHPNRPLSRNEITVKQASVFAGVLALSAISFSFMVSTIHGIGVLVPLVMLGLYAAFLKGTPVWGNVLVSLLVAYGIIFGGFMAPGLYRLYIPATLAFLLNVPREIIKDVQDMPGDTAAGIKTTASLPEKIIRPLVTICGILYALLVFLPYALHQFGALYGVICLVAVVPLHVYWNILVYKSNWRASSGLVSSLIKYEMLFGLLALALDQLFRLNLT
jgi:geranylgeranylglycerol-phosphate geranylgeranyltransferase